MRKLNAIRSQHGLRRLRSSRGLARAADAKSAAVVASGDFSHGALAPRVRGYVRARFVGETLAWVPPPLDRDVDVVVGTWMSSPSHRATLLSHRFARIGIGRRRGAGGSVIFTVNLASAR